MNNKIVQARRRLVPLKEAAPRIGLTVWGLRSWVYSGRIGHHKVGSKVCIEESEIERVISETERPRRKPVIAPKRRERVV